MKRVFAWLNVVFCFWRKESVENVKGLKPQFLLGFREEDIHENIQRKSNLLDWFQSEEIDLTFANPGHLNKSVQKSRKMKLNKFFSFHKFLGGFQSKNSAQWSLKKCTKDMKSISKRPIENSALNVSFYIFSGKHEKPKILGPVKVNRTLFNSDDSIYLNCEVFSPGKTQVQWLKQLHENQVRKSTIRKI